MHSNRIFESEIVSVFHFQIFYSYIINLILSILMHIIYLNFQFFAHGHTLLFSQTNEWTFFNQSQFDIVDVYMAFWYIDWYWRVVFHAKMMVFSDYLLWRKKVIWFIMISIVAWNGKKNVKMKSKQLCVYVEISKTCIFKSTANNTDNHKWDYTNIIFEYTSCCHWHKKFCGSSE